MILTYNPRNVSAYNVPTTAVRTTLKPNCPTLESPFIWMLVVVVGTASLEVSDEELLLLDEVGEAGIVPTTLVRVIVAEGTPPDVERLEGNTLVELMTEKFASKIWNAPLRLFTSPSTGVDEG